MVLVPLEQCSDGWRLSFLPDFCLLDSGDSAFKSESCMRSASNGTAVVLMATRLFEHLLHFQVCTSQVLASPHQRTKSQKKKAFRYERWICWWRDLHSSLHKILPGNCTREQEQRRWNNLMDKVVARSCEVVGIDQRTLQSSKLIDCWQGLFAQCKCQYMRIPRRHFCGLWNCPSWEVPSLFGQLYCSSFLSRVLIVSILDR